MEWANDKSKGGVLAHLERLETQMSRSCKNLKDPPRETAESDLRTKIHKLRCLRDKLRAEVKQRQARIKASTANAEPDQTLEISEQEAVGGKEENMKAILQAYRFTGLSGKRTSRGVCVCISTAFEGNLLDSYFVDLVIQKPLRIHHHSVPVFIPLEEISAKYLQTNIQHFLFCLCEYLNAYAGRKYQADQLQRDFAAFLAGPLQRNSLCNLLSFTYKVEPQGRSFPFCARLLYKDLTTTLPTDVTITYQGTDASSTSWEEQRASHENLFFTKPLHQVFTSFARNGERCGPGNRKLLKDSEPLPRDHPCNENIHPIMMVKGNIALSALMTKVAGVPEEPFKIIRNISMRAGSPSPDHMETSSSPA